MRLSASLTALGTISVLLACTPGMPIATPDASDSVAAETEAPNILFIVVDDLGFTDLGVVPPGLSLESFSPVVMLMADHGGSVADSGVDTGRRPNGKLFGAVASSEEQELKEKKT